VPDGGEGRLAPKGERCRAFRLSADRIGTQRRFRVRKVHHQVGAAADGFPSNTTLRDQIIGIDAPLCDPALQRRPIPDHVDLAVLLQEDSAPRRRASQHEGRPTRNHLGGIRRRAHGPARRVHCGLWIRPRVLRDLDTHQGLHALRVATARTAEPKRPPRRNNPRRWIEFVLNPTVFALDLHGARTPQAAACAAAGSSLTCEDMGEGPRTVHITILNPNPAVTPSPTG
jgi:hypothetical protein